MRRVAIMQPYLFPYIGYFNLIAACDVFAFCDDFQFIRRGWIHRNHVLAAGCPWRFTLPVQRAPRDTPIHAMRFAPSWPLSARQLLRTLQTFYSDAPGFRCTMALIEAVFGDFEDASVSRLAMRSVAAVLKACGITRELLRFQSSDADRNLAGAQRIVVMVKTLGGDVYINPPGGRNLYDSKAFEAHGIELKFCIPTFRPYDQGGRPFVEGLSIIDVLMWNSTEVVRSMILKDAILQNGASACLTTPLSSS